MASRQDQAVIAKCSFCSKPNTNVSTLVAGPGVFICDGCVALCAEVIAGKPASVPQVAPWEQAATLDEVLANLAPVAAAGAQVEHNLAAWGQQSPGPGSDVVSDWRSARDGPAVGMGAFLRRGVGPLVTPQELAAGSFDHQHCQMGC